MGCTSTKTTKAEGDLERYHQEIFTAAQTGDVKRLKDILDELDRRKASTTKKEVLNMGMYRFCFPLSNLNLQPFGKSDFVLHLLFIFPNDHFPSVRISDEYSLNDTFCFVESK